MQLLNLNEASRHKFMPAINKAGGRYSISEKLQVKGVGTAGLKYLRGLAALNYDNVYDKPVHVTLEKFRSGMGIYFRNTDVNYVLVLEAKEIDHIKIFKDLDTIAPPSNPFYKLGSLFSKEYLVLRNLLIEGEKIEFHPIEVTIQLHFNEPIVFEVNAFKPKKVINFIKSFTNINVQDNIEGFVIIP